MNVHPVKDVPSTLPRTFEDILHLINPLGRWQILLYALLSFLQVFFASVNLAVTFMQITPDFACQSAVNSSWTIDQINSISSPIDEKDKKKRRDACYIYDLPYEQWQNLPYDQVYAEAEKLQSTATKQKCLKWIFNTTVNMQNTLATQYDLVCDRALYVEHAQLVYMFGFFIGSIVSGVLSDKFGRKKVSVLAAVLSSLSSIALGFSPNFVVFIIIRFFQALSNIACVMGSFCLALEVTTSRWRVWIGGLFFIPYALGYTLLPLFAYFLRDWRYLHFAISAPTIVSLVYWWLIPESPRWLLVKKKVDEAEVVIRNAAKMNNRKLPEQLNLEKIAHAASAEEEEQRSGSVNILTVFLCKKGRFLHPAMLGRAVNIFFNWFVNSMVYYGVSLNISLFAGDVFVNNAIAGAVEFPGYIFCVPLLYWGRRKSLFLMLILAGLCLFVVPWIKNADLNWLKLVFVMSGKLCITASFALVYVFTSELYPTVIRNSGLSASSCIARIGSMIAPYISSIGKISASIDWIPMLIFGAFSLLAGGLTLLLPETVGKLLPDTLEDAKVYKDEDAKVTKDNKYLDANDIQLNVTALSQPTNAH